MRKVSTHWEVRRPKYHTHGEADVTRFTGPQAEAEARVNALGVALKGKANGYTGEVKLVEVETHERLDETFTQEGAVGLMCLSRHRAGS